MTSRAYSILCLALIIMEIINIRTDLFRAYEYYILYYFCYTLKYDLDEGTGAYYIESTPCTIV